MGGLPTPQGGVARGLCTRAAFFAYKIKRLLPDGITFRVEPFQLTDTKGGQQQARFELSRWRIQFNPDGRHVVI
jgi:hypothetical protein